MNNSNFINLDQLDLTTQSLLRKINEQSNLKVDKSTIIPTTSTGSVIASINGINIYNGETFSGDYYDLKNVPNFIESVNGEYSTNVYVDSLKPFGISSNIEYNLIGVEHNANGALKRTYNMAPISLIENSTYSKLIIGNNVSSEGCGVLQLYKGGSSPSTGYIQIQPGAPDNPRLSTTTNVLSLPHDSGTIALISDIPSWARSSTKPTYTATEVGALPSNTTYVSSVNSGTGDITINEILTTAGSDNTEYNLLGTDIDNNNTILSSVYNPTLISFAKYTNNFARLTLGSTTTSGILRLYTAVGSSGYTDLKSGTSSTNARTITFPDANGTVALVSDIPSVPSWALQSTKPTYTAAEVGATTSSDVSSMIASAVSNITSFSTEIVQSLPSTGLSGRIYFLSGNNNTNDIYEEYIYVNNGWEKLGNFDATNIDLSGYLKTSDISAWAKAANKPVYTASEVGALSTSTTYVSTFNGQSGAITYVAPVTSVNGQTGVVSLDIPNVPEWALATTKPAYTATEVGAAASNHSHTQIQTTGRDNQGKVITTSSSVEINAYVGQGGSSSITVDPAKIKLLASARNAHSSITTSIIFSTYPYDGNEIQHIKLSDGTTTINGVITPTTNDMAANKKYVDDAIAGITDTNTTYTLSMSGNIITLTPSTGTAQTITLPVYNGGVS